MDRTLFDIWPEVIAGPALLTTFTFNAPFFEMRVLPVLQKRRAHPIVVFVDNEGYEAALHVVALLDGAGRDYQLVPVRLGRCFHPKVHYFPAAGAAVVGSGNLTPGGCGANLEAFDVLAAVPEGRALNQVAAFFRALLEQDLGLDQADRDGLVAEVVDVPPSGQARFLHTLTQDLWGQVSLDAGDEATLIAPFHDGSHKTSREILRRVGPSRARVVAESAVPWRWTGAAVGSVVESDARPLHAKVVWTCGERVQLITGSANLTDAAWSGRNVEAVVVRSGPDGAWKDFRHAVELVEDDWYEPVEADEAEPSVRGLPLRWARLEGSALVLSCPELSAPTFTLGGGSTREAVSMRRVGELYRGTVEVVPPHALVLWVTAADGEAGVVVDQPALLSSVGRAGRIRRLLQRVEAGMAGDMEHRELVSVLSEVFGALHRASVRSGGRSSSTGSSGSFHGDSDEEILGAVEDLPYLAGSSARNPARGLARLLALVQQLARPTSFEAAERAEDQNEQSRQRETAGPKAPDLDSALRAELEDGARALLERESSRIRLLASRDVERAVVLHLTLMRLLDHCPGLGGLQLVWLAGAWGVAEWPDYERGWLLEAGQEASEVHYERAVSVWRRTRGGVALRDAAHRVVAGLDEAAESPVRTPGLDELRGHVTAGARAAAWIAPLWELEAGLREWKTGGSTAAVVGRYRSARSAAQALPAPGGEGASLFAVWERARPRRGWRVWALREQTCGACRMAIPDVEWSRTADPTHVIRCSCGVLLARGRPEELGG